MEQDKNFHLYLLIGQSNMAGRGELDAQSKIVHERVFALDKAGKWVPAADPLHFDKPGAGVGPGLEFGKTMAAHDPSVRIGLIPCAAGGSSISVWQEGAYWHQTNSKPYDDAIERAKLAMESGALKGILWHQGEGDSNEKDAPLYAERLAALIKTLRAELGAPDVPFIAATLGDFVAKDRPYAQMVNDSLMKLPEYVKNATCVEAAGLAHKGDGVHFDAASARELGRRYAKAMIRL